MTNLPPPGERSTTTAPAQVVAYILATGNIQPLLDSKLTLEMVHEDRMHRSLKWILEYHDKHGAVPSDEAFHRQFPTYKFAWHGDAVEALIDEMLRRHILRLYQDSIPPLIDQLGVGLEGVAPQVVTEGLRELLETVDVLQPEQGHWWSSEDLDKLPEARFLVADSITLGTVGWIAGQRASGKSTIALDIALCVANGLPWAGRHCDQRNVRYVAAEGFGDGIKQRTRAWEYHRLDGRRTPSERFRVFDATLSLQGTGLGRIKSMVDEMGSGLIVIDTFSKCSPGDYLNNVEMVALIGRLEQLVKGRECTVLLVHHHSIKLNDAKKASLLGASGLEDAANFVFAVTRPTSDHRLVNNTRQKDIEEWSKSLTLVVHRDENAPPGLYFAVADPNEVTDWDSGPEDDIRRVMPVGEEMKTGDIVALSGVDRFRLHRVIKSMADIRNPRHGYWTREEA